MSKKDRRALPGHTGSVIAPQGDFFPAGACDNDVADAALGIGNEFDLRIGGTLGCEGLRKGLGILRDVREVDAVRVDMGWVAMRWVDGWQGRGADG